MQNCVVRRPGGEPFIFASKLFVLTGPDRVVTILHGSVTSVRSDSSHCDLAGTVLPHGLCNHTYNARGSVEEEAPTRSWRREDRTAVGQATGCATHAIE